MSVKVDIDIGKSVPGFDFKVNQVMDVGGITAVFGPSGAGKTTLLRLIAGFETPDAGQVVVDGQVWDGPAFQRPVGYMFQDGRLFDHLSVKANLDYADKRCANKTDKFGIDAIIDAFDLGDLLGRMPESLSGGERKRAGLGRTLLTRPKLLLLDEPLEGLDRARKREILPFIESLPERFDLPCLYVSHDIEEVSRLADDILVLSGGQVQAYGPAIDIIGQLDLEPLTGVVDPSVLLEGVVKERDDRLSLTYVAVTGAILTLPLKQRLNVGDKVRLRVRAKDAALATQRPKHVSIRNILEGRVLEVTSEEHSAFADILIDIGGAQLRSRITRAAAEDLDLKVGTAIFALIKTMSFEGRLI